MCSCWTTYYNIKKQALGGSKCKEEENMSTRFDTGQQSYKSSPHKLFVCIHHIIIIVYNNKTFYSIFLFLNEKKKHTSLSSHGLKEIPRLENFKRRRRETSLCFCSPRHLDQQLKDREKNCYLLVF